MTKIEFRDKANPVSGDPFAEPLNGKMVPEIKTISWFIDQYGQNNMVSNPKYQRATKLWSESRRQLLIDSIMRLIGVPQIVLRKVGSRYEIVDGQQRLGAIKQFYDNELACGNWITAIDGLTYQDIPPEYQKRFMGFGVPCEIWENATDEEVGEIFRRRNWSVTVNPQEQRRAVPGKFNDVCRRLAGNKVFTLLPRSNKRASHEEMAAKLVILSTKQFQPTSTAALSVDEIYANNRVEILPETEEAIKRLEQVMGYLYEMFSRYQDQSKNKPQAIRWLKSQEFITVSQLIGKNADKMGDEKIRHKFATTIGDFFANLPDGPELTGQSKTKTDLRKEYKNNKGGSTTKSRMEKLLLPVEKLLEMEKVLL